MRLHRFPPRAVPSRAQLCDIVSKFVSKFALTKIINRLHAITHDWHLPRSCFLPPGKTVGTPWQRGLLPANSAKGIHVGNVHVMCINNR